MKRHWIPAFAGMTQLTVGMTKLVVVMALLVSVACAKPLVRGHTVLLEPVKDSFNAGTNAAYYGIRWALAERGYPIGYENLAGGIITSAWIPTTSDSHFLQPFNSKDYGTTGAYHQLELHVLPGGGVTTVSVASRVNSLVVGLKSSHREEKAVLQEIHNYLHGSGVQVTNVGVDP
jgi:hypothetical protein